MDGNDMNINMFYMVSERRISKKYKKINSFERVDCGFHNLLD